MLYNIRFLLYQIWYIQKKPYLCTIKKEQILLITSKVRRQRYIRQKVMKTINTFNFSEILNGVKNGQVSNLYIVSSRTFEDDANGDTEYKWDNEPYFAGSTLEEATETLQDVASMTSADEFEYVELDVRAIAVNADTFADVDEDEDAEDILLAFAEENADDAEFLDDSLYTQIKAEYESMDGGILVYWAWDRYIGYARTFNRFEVCNDMHITTLSCKPCERAYAENCDLLVTPAEVNACQNASELRDLMNERMADMKLWRNDYSADEFLSEAYEDSDCYGYELPDNDLYTEED